MRAKMINNNQLSFNELYNIAPIEIKEILDACELIPQSAAWHPEGKDEKVPHNVLCHIKIVFERAKETGDINFMLAAFFHDLGKFSTTVKDPSKSNTFHTKMHERVSARLVTKYRDWIEELGGDYDIIYYIVSEHMRAKHLHEMRPFKRQKFMDEPYFHYVKKFTEFDDMINHGYDYKN